MRDTCCSWDIDDGCCIDKKREIGERKEERGGEGGGFMIM